MIQRTQTALDQVNALHAAIDALPDTKTVEVNIVYRQTGDIPATMKATQFIEQVVIPATDRVAGQIPGVDVTAQTNAVRADANALRDLSGATETVTRDNANLAAAADALAARIVNETLSAKDATAALKAVAYAQQTITAATADNTNILSGVIPLWARLRSHVTLFGGALNNTLPAFLATATGIHILTDGALEIAATAIPALIAFGAFAAGAAGTVKNLYTHEKDVYTVTQALGQEMYPFTGQLSALSDAVKPEVYVLFGEGLQIINRQTGIFSALAQGAGRVLDDLGARFTVAVTKGSGFGVFLKNSVGDLKGWGTLIGNIGGIIGSLIKDMPGYAEIFLSLADGITHIVESAVQAAGPIINLGLAMHGALLWGGLAVTAIMALRGPLTSLVTWVAVAGVKLEWLGAQFITTASEEGIFAASMDLLAGINPLIWVAGAVAGLVVLTVAMSNTKSQAQQFNDAMQKALSNSALTSLQATMNDSIAQTRARLDEAATAAEQYNQKTHATTVNLREVGRVSGNVQAGYQQLTQVTDQYRQGLDHLQQQQSNVNGFIKQLIPITGSAGNAWQALNSIGITSSDIISANKDQLTQYIVEVQAYNDALRAATDGTGRFAAAENALAFANGETNNQLGQIDQSMKQVTQAQTQLMGVITGGETAFATFELGQQTLTQNFGGVNKATAQTVAHLGSLKLSSTLAGAAMSGTSAASLTLSQSFYSQVNNAQNLVNALEMQGITTDNLTAVVGTAAKQLLLFAGNNSAARATVVDLINNALGPGTVSMQSLNTWVGNNSTTMAGFKAIVDKTTVSASELANTLAQDVNNMMAQSIADAYGGQKAFDTFAKLGLNGANIQSLQFVQSGQQVIQTLLAQSGNNVPKAERAFISYAENALGYTKNQAETLWSQLYSNLNPTIANTGNKASTAAGQVKTLGQALANLPTGKSVNVTVQGGGGEYISSTIGPGGQVTVRPVRFMSAGGVLPGYEPGHDSVLTMLSKGEGVLIPEAVKALGGAKGIETLNKSAQHLASGGIAGLPQQITDTATGVFGNANAIVLSQVMTKIVAQVKAKIAAQVAAAMVASANGASLGGNVVTWIQTAMKDTMAPASWLSYLLRLVSLESGGNPNAVNPISVYGEHASGLFQTLPSTYAQFATIPGGVFNPVADAVAAIRYIMAKYGSPANIPGLLSGHYVGYDSGGFLMPGLTLAYNGTGRPEMVNPPGGGGDVHVHMEVNGREIAKATFPQLEILGMQKASRNRGNANASQYWTPGTGRLGQ